MASARVGEIALHFERAGEGRPLLFIGGSGGDLRQKPRVMEGPLAPHFDLLAYDQRGLGRSAKPPGPYAMAAYADDAAGLLDHVGWPSCAVIGVSFGGMVAQELVLRHPDRVARLVLACTSSGGEGGASYPLHTLSDLSPRERAVRGLELADSRKDAAWRRANPEAFEKLIEFSLARQDVGADEPDAARGAGLQLEARKDHDTWERLPEINAPTYLCGGRYDGIAPPDNMRALASRIPGSELELFEGGHLFLIQDRATFPRIIDFLSS